MFNHVDRVVHIRTCLRIEMSGTIFFEYVTISINSKEVADLKGTTARTKREEEHTSPSSADRVASYECAVEHPPSRLVSSSSVVVLTIV